MDRPAAPTILVVDDEVDVLESLEEFLSGEMPQARILTAPSGEQAMRIMQSQPVAAVLSDIRMPNMDGIALMRQVRSTSPECGRILMTAFIDPDTEERARQVGVETVVHKPFDLDHLLDVVRETVDDPGPTDWGLAS